jgi:uncharacterized protein (TIGR02300 family)
MRFDTLCWFVANAAPFNSGRKDPLIKPELGAKRVCPSCGVRFYDLQKRPIECPKCSFAFEPELLLKQRRTRMPEEKPAVPPATGEEEEVEAAEGEGAEAAEDEELEEEDEIPEADEPLIEADIESDEDAEPAAEEKVEPEEFEEDLEGEEEEGDELLEEVEEDEDDVSGIIDADIEKDEP